MSFKRLQFLGSGSKKSPKLLHFRSTHTDSLGLQRTPGLNSVNHDDAPLVVERGQLQLAVGCVANFKVLKLRWVTLHLKQRIESFQKFRYLIGINE